MIIRKKCQLSIYYIPGHSFWFHNIYMYFFFFNDSRRTVYEISLFQILFIINFVLTRIRIQIHPDGNVLFRRIINICIVYLFKRFEIFRIIIFAYSLLISVKEGNDKINLLCLAKGKNTRTRLNCWANVVLLCR